MKIAMLTAALALVAPAAAPNPFPAQPVPAPYGGVTRSSRYVAMRDGVKLAVEVYQPGNAPAGAHLPAMLRFTRYGRAPQDAKVIPGDAGFWATRGYVAVAVDQRGTGSSFGRIAYGKPNLDDMRAIVDWIVAQPWSNGRLGAIGTSYEGTTAELLAAAGHPSVRAVAPLFSDYDYLDLFEPGGMFSEGLASGFAEATAAMDAGGAAAPVDGDPGGASVRAAVAEHAANPDLLAALRGMEYSDDSVPGFGVPPADFGIPGVRAALARAKVPELVVASWYDAATVFGVLQRYKDVAVPQRVVIVATNHGGSRTADPYGAPAANAAGSLGPQLRLAFAFFQPFLVDGTPGAPPPNSITYFTVGENAWKTTAVWPPAGVAAARWYLGAARRLTPTAARGVTEALPLAAVTTGAHSVWFSQLTGEDVVLSEVAHAANAAPVYTTVPLTESIEVTGIPELRLEMSAPIADPSVVAFLLAVAPDGTAYELTQGELRLIHRKLAPSQVTLHTFSRRDALAVVPNAPLDVPIALVPISATVPKGYRLRIALASGERPVLAESPSYTARITGTSYLSLPIRPRPDLDTR